MENEELLCCKCKLPLVNKRVTFKYLSYTLSEELPQCPKCGQVYISESFVKERIESVEAQLEEK
jgi:uncharacterized protein with PIN domain